MKRKRTPRDHEKEIARFRTSARQWEEAAVMHAEGGTSGDLFRAKARLWASVSTFAACDLAHSIGEIERAAARKRTKRG